MLDLGFGVHFEEISESELASMLMWRNDPKIYRWCRQVGLLNWEQHFAWYKRQSVDPATNMFAVHAPAVSFEGRQFVGVAGLTSIDQHNRRAEFSLYIAPEFHKRGHAKAALKTLFSHGFRDLGLNLIWGESIDLNPAQKMFLDLGMVKEGVRRDFYFKEGRFWDAQLFSLKKAEWEIQKWNTCSQQS